MSKNKNKMIVTVVIGKGFRVESVKVLFVLGRCGQLAAVEFTRSQRLEIKSTIKLNMLN
jgi:hypothetical protein